MLHEFKVLWKINSSRVIYAKTWELCFLVMVSVLLLLYHIYQITLDKTFNYIYFRLPKALLDKNIPNIIFIKLQSDCESPHMRPAQVRSTHWSRALNGRQINLWLQWWCHKMENWWEEGDTEDEGFPGYSQGFRKSFIP